jgi:SAM-dependent methyltransferase
MELMKAPVLDVDDRAYFERLADVEERHWWSRAMWRIASFWLDAAIGDRSGLLALDVGCGAGLSARRLLDRREVAEVVGLDPSPEALRHARRFPSIAFFAGSALDLPFEDASFDLVTCFDVLQHIPLGGDRRASREIARVLRPGGIVLIRTNGRGFRGDDSCYRVDGLREIVDRAGLRVRRASQVNMLPSLVQELRGALPGCGASGHPSGGGLTIQVPSVAHNRLMGVVAGAEAWLVGRLGVALPFGHSTLLLAEKRG